MMRFDAKRGASIRYDGAWLHQPVGPAQMAYFSQGAFEPPVGVFEKGY